MTAEREAWDARMARKAARDRARHREQSAAETALTIAQATALLPKILRDYGDTGKQQAERRRVLMRGMA